MFFYPTPKLKLFQAKKTLTFYNILWYDINKLKHLQASINPVLKGGLLMRYVLCVSFGNTCRSAMFQMLFCEALQNRKIFDVQVESAGTSKAANLAKPANKHSITCMRERGLDLQGHRSRWINELDLQKYDLVLCMNQVQYNYLKVRGVPVDKILIIDTNNQGEIPYPKQTSLPAHRRCVKVLEEAINDIIARICIMKG